MIHHFFDTARSPALLPLEGTPSRALRIYAVRLVIFLMVSLPVAIILLFAVASPYAPQITVVVVAFVIVVYNIVLSRRLAQSRSELSIERNARARLEVELETLQVDAGFAFGSPTAASAWTERDLPELERLLAQIEALRSSIESLVAERSRGQDG